MLEERRLELAKEAARRTVGLSVIAPTDQVGVLAFGDQSQWISPLAPCGDKQKLLAAIDTLQAVGATNMAPALERARLALKQSDADRRHAIVLSDGVSTPGDFDRLARDMAAAGITVSTVSVSQGADQTILRDIARTAGGRHYHCDDPREVPRILEEETRSTAQAAATAVRPMVYRALPGLNLDAAPELAAHVEMNPKPGAELVLLTQGGDPLLALGTHGKGKVAAMAADITGTPAVRWRKWSGYAPFLARLARHVLPTREPPFRIATEHRFGRLHVTLDSTHHAPRDADLTRSVKSTIASGDSVELTASFPTDNAAASHTQKLTMHPGAAGRYEATIDATAMGIYQLDVRMDKNGTEPEASQRLALAVDYPDELRLGPVDELLLGETAKVSGGSVMSENLKTIRPDGRTVERLRQLAPLLTIIAMLLLTTEVYLRRN
jgi:hypothetical protein